MSFWQWVLRLLGWSVEEAASEETKSVVKDVVKSVGKHSAKVFVAAALMIGGWEGMSTVVYKDPTGTPTVCYGETQNIKFNHKYTAAECKKLLSDRLPDYAAAIDRHLKVSVPDLTYEALLSLVYNIGEGNFAKSTVLREFNAGHPVAACNAFTMWTKSKGKTLPGLVKRRAAEKALCLKGYGK